MDGIKSMGVNFEPIKENHGSNKRVFKKNQIKVMLPLFNNREYLFENMSLLLIISLLDPGVLGPGNDSRGVWYHVTMFWLAFLMPYQKNLSPSHLVQPIKN